MKIVIVGGVAGGATAAARLRRIDEDAEIEDVETDYEKVVRWNIDPIVDTDHSMLKDLKFSELLPSKLFQATAQARLFSEDY